MHTSIYVILLLKMLLEKGSTAQTSLELKGTSSGLISRLYNCMAINRFGAHAENTHQPLSVR